MQSKDDTRNFTVIFTSSLSDTVDIIWMNKAGEEVTEKPDLAEGEDYEKATFYNHFWVFKKSGTEIRLIAIANDVKQMVFEGSKFGAEVNNKIRVKIEEIGKI